MEEWQAQLLTDTAAISVNTTEIISQLNSINVKLDQSGFVSTYAYSGTGFSGDWRSVREITTGDTVALLAVLPLYAFLLVIIAFRAMRGRL